MGANLFAKSLATAVVFFRPNHDDSYARNRCALNPLQRDDRVRIGAGGWNTGAPGATDWRTTARAAR
jgi:hypothetical protein